MNAEAAMATVRYRVVQELPASARTPEFADLDERSIRVRVLVQGDEVVIVATGLDPRAVEELLIRLGATEIGVDLCG